MATFSRPAYGRVLRWSVVLSVLLHLLALLVSPTFIQTRFPPGGAAAPADAPRGAFGIEAIVVVPSENAPELPVAQTTDEPEPIFTPPPVGATPTPSAAGGGAEADAPTPAGAEPPAVSASDALRPGYRDPRLYVAPRPLRDLDQTDHERYMEHLQARIDAVNDSMAVSANRNSATRDWTVTDESGNRWGIDSDGLHLGGLTIPPQLVPLPSATGDNQSLEAGREQQRQRDEIRRQEADRERRQTENERIEAVRERRESERNAAE